LLAVAIAVRDSEGVHGVSKAERERLRREAEASRERIVATVGEFATAARATKDEAVASVKRYAPIAGGAAAGLALLKIVRGRRRRSSGT
jgi:hypothetical protein